MKNAGDIYVGMGGWRYEPWRETFYPATAKAKDELHYASRQVTAIEINSTFYRLQTPSVFAKWRDTVPHGFVFAIKAPRFVVQRKVLGNAAESVQRFLNSGVAELGPRLGPILWQLAPTHAFDADDMAAFLALLPKSLGGLNLRHALNVRHASFRNPVFIDAARKHDAAIVFEDDEVYPAMADLTADFVYARLRQAKAAVQTGYTTHALAEWSERAKTWASGDAPNDLPCVATPMAKAHAWRDVFVFFINGAKERAPAAACELLKKLAMLE